MNIEDKLYCEGCGKEVVGEDRNLGLELGECLCTRCCTIKTIKDRIQSCENFVKYLEEKSAATRKRIEIYRHRIEEDQEKLKELEKNKKGDKR